MSQRNDYPLTGRTVEVLDFILSYKLQNDGVAPSIRDIIAATDMTSTNMVWYYLRKLEGTGLIQLLRDENGNAVARGITIPGASWQPPNTQIIQEFNQ